MWPRLRRRAAVGCPPPRQTVSGPPLFGAGANHHLDLVAGTGAGALSGRPATTTTDIDPLADDAKPAQHTELTVKVLLASRHPRIPQIRKRLVPKVSPAQPLRHKIGGMICGARHAGTRNPRTS